MYMYIIAVLFQKTLDYGMKHVIMYVFKVKLINSKWSKTGRPFDISRALR